MLTAACLLAGAVSSAPNVVLVTIDTLRADRVGAYGHAAAHTPTLDRLAREGVLLEDAVVQVPQTRPSHATIFTGLQPYEHGLRDNYSPPLAAGTPTLATLLRTAGWDTAAFIAAYPVSRLSGLDQGFAVYDDPFSGAEGAGDGRTERKAGEVVDRALGWLRKPRTRPFFAWVHLFDPHAPYEAPAPWRARFARNPYDGEVAYADAEVGRLLAWLDSAGLRERTLVVATSDHGEGLGEHGEDEHMFFVYDSTLRVPLLFSWPGRLPAGARVGGQFRSVDLLATVLEIVGVNAGATSGVSRASLLRPGGRIRESESYAETLYSQLHFGYAPLRALRGDGWKYVDAPRPELYRLADDPGEKRNLVDERATVAAAMRQQLLTYDRARGVAPQLPTLDPDAAERLAALGYVGGAGGGAGFATSGVDPKDKIAVLQAYQRDVRRGMALYRERDLDGAIQVLGRAARAVTSSFNVNYYLGRSLVERRRFTEAVPYLEKAAGMAPARQSLSGLAVAPVYAYLAEALGSTGRAREATRALADGLEIAPASPDLLRAKGGLLLRRGDVAGARAALEKARDVEPRDPRLHVELSGLYRNLADLERSRLEAVEAIRLDPRSPDAHVALGLALGALGREPQAGRAFREALRVAPDHPDALFYLGSVELRAGRAPAAVTALEKLVAKAPDYPRGQETLAAARGLAAPPPPGAARLRLLRSPSREKAEAIVRRLAAGEAFAALARAESTDASASRGGDLGTVRVDDLAEPLRSAAGALAPGQVSPVLESADGYVLLKRER